MAEVLYEDWTGVALGADPATLAAWSVIGTGSTREVVDDPSIGPGVRSAAIATTGDSGWLRAVEFAARSELYTQFYWQSPTMPGSGNKFILMIGADLAWQQAQVRVSGTAFQIRNGNSAVDTGTLTIVADQWYRLEHAIDTAADEQALRIFTGGNLHGSTPDETLTGSYTRPNPSRVDLGPKANPDDVAFTALFSRIRVDDAEFVAPYEPAVDGPMFAEWDGTTLQPLTVAEWDGTTLQPLTVAEA